ncbi:HET-domain-containing protein [Acephala macrosclerotiorum]|nr:HET-domain-containing protein [Acephala macrosclerotiorum]
MSTPPQLELALTNAQDVIKLFPNNAQAHISMADICERLARFDEAEAALLIAVDLTTGMSRIRAHQLLANLRAKRAEKQTLRPNSQTPSPSPVTAPPVNVEQTSSTLIVAPGVGRSLDRSSNSNSNRPSTPSPPQLRAVVAEKSVQLQYPDSPYQYMDLTYSESQIRLVTLYPASRPEETIKCSLAVATLPSAKGGYEALSYVWGDQSIKHQVIIDGRWLDVTSNLLEALRHLRHQTEPLVLWIDAICINQTNMEEKNHQVRQMRNVYASASRVLIWLGESDADIDAAFQYIQKPKKTRNEEIKTAFDILGGNLTMERQLAEESRPVEGLRKLYKKPWWTRMWVVQELVAATEDPMVICGNNNVNWGPVCEAVGKLALDGIINNLVAGGVVDDPFSSTLLYFGGPGSRDPEHRGEARTLEHLLGGTRTHNATDPRDHVYALLDLVSGNIAELFEADYTKPARIAYQHAMVHVFRVRQDLDLLAYASGVDAVDIPSWCIDFSSKTWGIDAISNGLVIRESDPRVTNRRRILREGASRGQGFAEAVHEPEAGAIKLRGIRLGLIHSVVESTTGVMRYMAPIYKTISQKDLEEAPVTDVTKLLQDTFLFRIHATTALEMRYGFNEAARKVAAGDIWKVAAGGHGFNSLHKERGQQFHGMQPFGLLETFAQRVHPARADLLGPYSQTLPAEPTDFDFVPFAREACINIAQYTGKKSSYFTTDVGDIGLAYNLVQKGDVLCILFSCKYPVVLRPQKDDTMYHKLVAAS